jgi:hypothetical protein
MRNVGATVGGPKRVLRISDPVAGAVDSQPAARMAVAATVQSSGQKAVKATASSVAAIPTTMRQRVGVMSRKTLDGVLNAGETAMKVLRGIT